MNYKKLLVDLVENNARLFYYNFGSSDLQDLRINYGIYPYAGIIPGYCEVIFSDVALKNIPYDCVFSDMEKSEANKNFFNTEIRPKFYYGYVL